MEILQMLTLKPKFAVMDETDSGLDIDALRIVSKGVNRHGRVHPSGCWSSHTTSAS
jgi:Fe-S cluster assembly ATPase SufC